MPVNPETQNPAGIPKKKKKPPPVPAVTVNAVEGGQGVKDTHKAATATPAQVAKKYSPPVVATPAATLGVAEVKHSHKAAKQSQKELKKKYPEVKSHKRIRQIEAKKKTVAKILNVDPSNVTKKLIKTDTDAIRVAQIGNLKLHKKELADTLKSAPTQQRKSEADPGVALQRVKNLQAQLDQTNAQLTKLKAEHVGELRQKIRANIHQLDRISNQDHVDKKEVRKMLRQQHAALHHLKDQQERLNKSANKRQEQAQSTKKQFTHRVKSAYDFLDQTKGDPAEYQDVGFRQRGQYEDTKLKFPGVPGWQKYDAARPSSALEDAASSAQYFIPIPIFKGLQAAAKGTKLATGLLRGSRAVKGAIGGLTRPYAVALSDSAASKIASKVIKPTAAKFGNAARGINEITRPYTAAIGHGAELKAARKSGDVLTTMGVKASEGVATKDGGVILHKGVYENAVEASGQTVQKRADQIAESVDAGLTSIADRTINMLPTSKNDLRHLGENLATSSLANAPKIAGLSIGVGVPALIEKHGDVGKAASLIARDSYDLVTGIVPSTYQLLEAGVEAVRGYIPGADDSDASRLNELKDLFLEHDPVGLALQGKFDEALAAWGQRPVSTLLELAGAEYVVGRGIGTGMRYSPEKIYRSLKGKEGGVGTGAASIGNVLKLGPEETKAVLRQYYSPDILRKKLRQWDDKYQRKVTPQHFKDRIDKEVRKRVDEEHGVYRNEYARVFHGTMMDISKKVRDAEKIHPNAPHALTFMISKIARTPKTARKDLIAYRDDLAKMSPEIYRNETITVLNHLIDMPKAKLEDPKLWQIADKYIKEEHDLQEQLQQYSSLNKTQADFAKWLPYMVHHLKGKFIERNGKEVFALDKQMRLPNGKLSKKYLDPRKQSDLDIVKSLAPEGMSEPGFFSMRDLSDTLWKPEAEKKVNLKGPQFFRRSGDAVRNGTFDPTYNALLNHRMNLHQTFIDGDYTDNLFDLHSPFRRNAETGKISFRGTLYHGTQAEREKALLGDEGLSAYRRDEVWATANYRDAVSYGSLHHVGENVEPTVLAAKYNLENVYVPKHKELDDLDTLAQDKNLEYKNNNLTVAEAREQGYDGYLLPDNSVVAFDKTKVDLSALPKTKRDPDSLQRIIDQGQEKLRKNNVTLKRHQEINNKPGIAYFEKENKKIREEVQAAEKALESSKKADSQTPIGPETFKISKTKDSKETFYQDTYDKVKARLDDAYKRGTLHPDDFQIVDLGLLKSNIAQSRGFGSRLKETDDSMGAGSSAVMRSAIKDAVESAKNAETRSSDRMTFAAIPKQVLERVDQHTRLESNILSNSFLRGAAALTREFKGGVLPFNPRWQFGNIFDMTTRALMDQTGPISYAKGVYILHKLKKSDIDAYHQLLDRLGSGYMSEAFGRAYEDIGLQPNVRRASVGSGAEFRRGRQGFELQLNTLRSILRSPADAANEINRSLSIANGFFEYVGTKGLRGYRGLQELGFGAGRKAERQFRKAQLGKETTRYLRNIENNWKESLLITPKAIENTLARLGDKNVQAALARRVNNVMGDYTRLSPHMRMATQSYAPFALWFRASITWVLGLPKHHPAKTALLASVNRLTEPERRQIGLSTFHPQEPSLQTGMAGKQAKDTKDPYLLGSIVSGGQLYPTKTLSSFGTFYGAGADVGDFLVPQIASGLMIGKGVYWNGKELRYPDGSVPGPIDILGIQASNLLESYFPAFKYWKYYKSGSNPDETATVWNYEPQGHRDTYISPYAGANRYEGGEENFFQNTLSPLRSFPVDFTTQNDSTKLPPPKKGPEAEAYGASIRATNEKNALTSHDGQGWLDAELNQNQRKLDKLSPPRKTKPKQGWLDDALGN